MSTKFIEYLLRIILSALQEMTDTHQKPLTDEQRIEYFMENFQGDEFSRKDYLKMFPSISSPTASRDLKLAVEKEIFIKFGKKRLTRYKIKNN